MLRSQTFSKEVKNMTKARKFGINTPYILFVDYENRKIYMQYVANSIKMRDFLNKDPPEQSSLLIFFIFSIHFVIRNFGDYG